jgi:hypothetical protein
MGRLYALASIWTAVCATCGGFASVAALRAAEPAASPAPTALERVHVAGRAPYEGLIDSEDDHWIQFVEVHRPEGEPMFLVCRPIPRRQIAAIERLEPSQHAALRQQIERYRNHAAIEAGRMEAVLLKPAEGEGNKYRRYEGRWFTLDSTTGEWAARLAVVRAEQIFAAYRQILPPRTAPRHAPRLIMLDSTAEYRALLNRLGYKLDNRACFLEKENLVAVASDLAGAANLAAKVQLQNEQIRLELDRLQADFDARVKKTLLQMRSDGRTMLEIRRTQMRMRHDFEEQINKKRQELRRAEGGNQEQLLKMAAQVYTRLYHESFHAYLENYVYPHAKHNVPYWLNEGLAVMYEGAVRDYDALRVDAANTVMLKKLREELRKGRKLPLAKLLAAGPNEFLSHNNAPAPAAEQFYMHAWGLVYYLAIEKRLLGTPALDRYVEAGAEKLPPERRFERLVGMPLEQFENEWEQAVPSWK